MQEDKRVAARVLALAAGSLGGLLLAVSVQIVLGNLNVGMAAVWSDVPVAPAVQMRSALAWWMVAATALGGGYGSAALARSLLVAFARPPGLWLAGIAGVAMLAVAGHFAETPGDFDAPALVAANFAGMAGALVTAAMGAIFALRA